MINVRFDRVFRPGAITSSNHKKNIYNFIKFARDFGCGLALHAFITEHFNIAPPHQNHPTPYGLSIGPFYVLTCRLLFLWGRYLRFLLSSHKDNINWHGSSPIWRESNWLGPLPADAGVQLVWAFTEVAPSEIKVLQGLKKIVDVRIMPTLLCVWLGSTNLYLPNGAFHWRRSNDIIRILLRTSVMKAQHTSVKCSKS